MQNIFSERLLVPSEVRLGPNSLELGVRLPWYRAMPLSIVEVAELRVDDVPVPQSELRLAINDKEFGLGELGDQTREYWYVLDSARLRVQRAFDPHIDHRIVLTLNLYPPYIPGLTWVTRGALELKGH